MVSPPPFLLVSLSIPSSQETENKRHTTTEYIKLGGVGFKHLCIDKVGEQKLLWAPVSSTQHSRSALGHRQGSTEQLRHLSAHGPMVPELPPPLGSNSPPKGLKTSCLWEENSCSDRSAPCCTWWLRALWQSSEVITMHKSPLDTP